MHSLLQDIRYGLRQLRKSPSFTLTAVLTLAFGIGATTALFSVVDGVLLKPLAYRDSGRLVVVWERVRYLEKLFPYVGANPRHADIWRKQSTAFTDLTLLQQGSTGISLGADHPRLVGKISALPNLLDILGVQPTLGRNFLPDEAVKGHENVAIISYRLWQTLFNGDTNVIGRSVQITGTPFQIIGVLPQSFYFPKANELSASPLARQLPDNEIITPLAIDPTKSFGWNSDYGNYVALGRLKPGISIAQATENLNVLADYIAHQIPPDQLDGPVKGALSTYIQPMKEVIIGRTSTRLWLLMAAVLSVLLIACINLANAQLARVVSRDREAAVRSALGASRARIAGEILMESVALGLFGSLIGLGLAFTALRVLVAIAPSGLPRIDQISIDGPVLLFTLAVALLCSFLIACIPVFKYAGVRLSTGIREGGRALSQSREQHRARSVLVVIQVAMALVLLICSGLMIRTFRALTHVDPGFTHPEQLQTFRLYVPDTLVKEDESVLQFQHQLIDKLGQIPGVTSATLNTTSPMDGNDSNDLLYAEDHPINEGQVPPIRRFKFVSPGNFSTLGTRLLAGRDYTWTDVTQKAPNAIISENFAREYWGSPENAIGKRIRVASTDDWRQIIGVVANFYDHGVHKDPPSTVYWPLARLNFEGQKTNYVRGGSYILRSTRTGSESFLKEIRETVWSLNPNLPLSSVYSADYYYKRSMARTSFTLVMLGVAGSMALLLGVVGIYGVIAYSVLQRNREIGIRMALGAQQKIVTGMFVRYGLSLTSIGVAIGLIAAVIVMRLMSSLLFHVNPVDPITYLAVSAGLLFTAYVASYLPSRRAATVDPVDALRSE